MIRHLFVPGLLDRPPDTVDLAALARFPALERFIARSREEPVQGGLEELLMNFFGLQASQGGAPFCYLADAGQRPETGVLRAFPVHLRADRDRVLLFPLDESQLNMDEAQALAAQFNEHFSGDGLAIEVHSPHRWYLLAQCLPRTPLATLDQVAGRSLGDYLPHSEADRFWLSVINETQMLFFDSPLNRKREQAGRLPVNGLWFDGAGRLPETVPRGASHIDGNHCLLRGLAACSEEQGEDALILFEDIQQSLLIQDAASWLQARQRLEGILNPLMRETQIMLYSCDGRRWHWKPACNRHFWRLSRPLCWS
ncbi:hypothetical protein [Thiolapillus sp.]